MTEDELQLQARLSAIEHLIGLALVWGHLNAKHTVEQARELHRRYLENLRAQSLCIGDDPAMSDMASDEVVQHVERILAGVKTLLEQVQPPRP